MQPVTLLTQTRHKERRCSCESSVFAQNALVESVVYVPDPEIKLQSLSLSESKRALYYVNQSVLYPVATLVVGYLSEIDPSCLEKFVDKKWSDFENSSYMETEGSISLLDSSIVQKHLVGLLDEKVEDSEPEDDVPPRQADVWIPPRREKLPTSVLSHLDLLGHHVVYIHAIREYDGAEQEEKDARKEGRERSESPPPTLKSHEGPFSCRFKTHHRSYRMHGEARTRYRCKKSNKGWRKNERYEMEMLQIALYDGYVS